MRRVFLMVLVLVIASLFVGCENKAQMEEMQTIKDENTELQEKLAEAETKIEELEMKLNAYAEELGDDVEETKEEVKEQVKEETKTKSTSDDGNTKKKVKR